MYLSQRDSTPQNKPIFSDFHGFEWGYPPANPSMIDMDWGSNGTPENKMHQLV